MTSAIDMIKQNNAAFISNLPLLEEEATPAEIVRLTFRYIGVQSRLFAIDLLSRKAEKLAKKNNADIDVISFRHAMKNL